MLISLKKIFYLLFLFLIPFIKHSQASLFPKIFFIGDNFHCVEKNKLYRSKQLSKKNLKKYISKYGIKTVLNLRGTPTESWFYDEREACKEMNVMLHSISLTERKLPSREQVEQILHIFDTAPGPILVHCKSGADRTGMICALWNLDKQNYSTKWALKQLSFSYGHVEMLHPPMKMFIKMWQGREWFYNNYFIGCTLKPNSIDLLPNASSKESKI